MELILRAWRRVTHWFDNEAAAEGLGGQAARRIDWTRLIPFITIHALCLGVIWAGVSTIAVIACMGLYALRMFAITGFYHRYFSHRAFRTSRAAQFVFAVIGASAAQRGPLWWISHHRHHHIHADEASDAHSPRQHGFLWSHCGWFLARENFATRTEFVKDFARYPELRFLDRFDILVPLALCAALLTLGETLRITAPELGTSGPQLLIWGFCISTVMLYHATFFINSLAHCAGSRRYATHDDSRNNAWLAVLTLGEGWHNNHHHFPGAARQGFRWWEVDLTYYALRVLGTLRIIRDLREVPPAMLHARESTAHPMALEPDPAAGVEAR